MKQHFLFDVNGVGPKIVQRIYDQYKSIKPLAELTPDQISLDLKIKIELAQEIQIPFSHPSKVHRRIQSILL